MFNWDSEKGVKNDRADNEVRISRISGLGGTATQAVFEHYPARAG